MSNYTIEVTENIVNLDVLQDHDVIIEITSSDNFITFDTPSGYPILATSGILPVDRVASGYPISNLLDSSTIVRTSGNQDVSGIKTFYGDSIFVGNVTSSGSYSIKSQPGSTSATQFPVFLSDPSSSSKVIYTRTPSQIKSDLGISDVQNIALSGITFTAGSGLVGGGALSSSRSFDIGQGDGLTVSADSISIDSTVVRSSNVDQVVSGIKTFSGSGLVITSPSGTYKKDIALRGSSGLISNNVITIAPVSTIYTNRTYYLPEAGADADFVMTAGGQVITGPKTFTNTLVFNSGSFQSLKVGSTDVALNGHTHSISNINGLQAVLDLKQPSGSYALSNHSHSSFPSLYLGSPNLETCLNISVPSSYETNQYQDTSVLQITNDDLASTVFAIDGLGQIKYGTIDSTNVNGLNGAITAQIPTTIVHTTGNQSISGIKTFNNNINVSGLTTANSGNFTNSLKVNGTDVSISGHSHSISDITSLQTALDNKQPSGSYASSSHTHTSSDITNFNASVSGLVSGIYAPLFSPSFSGVPLVPTASAGTNTQQIANTSFVRTEISNLVASAPSALDTLNELATALGNDANFSTTVTNNLASKASLSGAIFTGSISGPSGNFTSLKVNNVDVSANGHTHTISDITNLQTVLDGKQPSGNYAASSHTHTSSNITDFNSSVSGLLPVKNILAGYDINITNNSGVYTVASTNLVHVDSQQPQGFVNRTDSRISVSGNIFRIEPTGSSYSYYNKGIKVVKTSGDSLTIPNLTQINYIHFDTVNNQISNKTTGFDFSSDIPIAYVAWNSGVDPSGQMTFFAEERHGIVMDTSTHKWIHNTFGSQYVGGLSIGNYSTSGNGNSNSDATIAIGNGTLYQEDIEINITNSPSTDPFCQELSPIAQIPVYYHQGRDRKSVV